MSITRLDSLAESPTRPGHFRFLKARYMVELTGKRVKNLQEFADVLKVTEPTSLFYHVYHPLLEAHLVPYEFPNDFSYWFSDAMQEKDLAEQVGNISLPEKGGLEEVRDLILSRVEHALVADGRYEVRHGREFDFVKCRFVVFPTGAVAKNLDELADGIAQASELCIFYHMVTSRLFKSSRYDDFSEWIIANTPDSELAEQIRSVDPTTHMNVRSMQAEVLAIVQRYLKRKRHTSRVAM